MDFGGWIASEAVAAHQRRMTIYVAALKRLQLGYAAGVLGQNARKIYEF